MSAKEHYHPPSVPRPLIDQIPPELWSTIFRHATEPVFAEYRFTGHEALGFISGIDRDQHKEYRASLVCHELDLIDAFY